MHRLLGALALLAVSLVGSANTVGAQGTTTGAIIGNVTDTQGQVIEGAQIQVVNPATGYSVGATTRANGQYLIQGLEVARDYTVRVRRVGFEPAEKTGVVVLLLQSTKVDFQLRAQAVQVGQVVIIATDNPEFSPTRQGIGTTVTDTMLNRIPLGSRDFTDLSKLAPQVARPQNGGASGGGAWNRFNSFQIDGANQNDRFALNSSGGVPGGASGGKLISVDAIKEFKVLLSPTDVRLGNFSGMLVNAVTKSGTNTMTGGASFTFRNEDFSSYSLRASPLSVKNYGFTLGGPIIKDKMHFFVAPEWQQRTRPATGQYVGAPASFQPALNVASDSIEAIRTIVKGRADGIDIGSSGLVSVDNPLTNLFGRIDYLVKPNHRLVVRQLINTTNSESFSRTLTTYNSSANTQPTGFRMGTNSFTGQTKNNSSVAQLFSNFEKTGIQNELSVGYNTLSDIRLVSVLTPEVGVAVVPVGATGTAQTQATQVVTFGTEEFSPDNIVRQKILEVTDNVTVPIGVHTVTVGGRYEWDDIYDNFAQRSYGVYTFSSIASLAAGTPAGYSVGYANDPVSGIAAKMGAKVYSLYAQDQWSPTPRLLLTAGVRADMPQILGKPPLNDSLAVLIPIAKTSDTPKTQILWSPRVGFNYDPTGRQENQIRGNFGIFTGQPPLVLIVNGYQNTGLGLVALNCQGADAPAFTLDITKLPHACAGKATPLPKAAGTAGVNVTDPNFKYPQYLGGSLGFDRVLPGGVIFTAEGLYRKAIHGVLIRDLNLKGPRMVNGAVYKDVNGRVLYADTISATGTVTNNNRYITSFRGTSFSEGLIQVTNQNKDYNWTLSGQLHKRFSPAFDVTGAYTHMRSRDVQSLTSDRAISNFRNGRQLANSHDDLTAGTSYFDRPHRLMGYGTYTLPWKSTDVSFYYEGMSGTAFTYVTTQDINGDLVSANDPIYVPTSARDTAQIKLGTGVGAAYVQDTTMANAFNKFITEQACLNSQRGTIMKRNSCRSPWANRLDIGIRQTLPKVRGQQVTVRLDVYNALALTSEVLHALNWQKQDKFWGQVRLPRLSADFPQQSVLSQVGRNPGALNVSQPTYTFSTSTFYPTATATLANPVQGPFTAATSSVNRYVMQLTFHWSY
jgi:outer membrane receptor protein involved in Fe transport